MAAPRTRTNQENFEQLVSAVAAGNCVAFLGAGFLGPMPGPYRSWTELLQHAVKEVSSVIEEGTTTSADITVRMSAGPRSACTTEPP